MVNLDFNVLVFLTGFVFALPIIGYLFRFNIPISIFFLLAGTFMIAIFLATDGIIISYDQFTNSTQISEVIIGNTTVYHYIVETSNTNLNTFNGTGGNKARAEALSSSGGSLLVGDVLQCIDLYLARVGTLESNPTAITVGVYSSTNSISPIQLYGVLDPSTLTTSLTFYPFCVPEGNERTLQSGDRIGFNYNAGNSTNYVLTRSNDVSGGGTFDGTTTLRVSSAFGSSVWGSATPDGDMTMRLYDFELDTAIIEDFDQSIQPNEMDFTFTGENYQLKVIMIFISVMFIVGGALVEVRQR